MFLLSWLGRLSLLAKVAGFVAAFTGAIVGAAAAWPVLEPFWYVSRAELRLVMDKQAVATDRQTLFQLQEYLDRAKRDPGAATSPIVQDRIRDLERQIEQTTARIQSALAGK